MNMLSGGEEGFTPLFLCAFTRLEASGYILRSCELMPRRYPMFKKALLFVVVAVLGWGLLSPAPMPHVDDCTVISGSVCGG
jgi:hypothetical protein